jgi:hypothetical protein
MQSCDIRLLEDIKAVEGLRALQFVRAIQPTSFRSRGEEKQKHVLGYVGQDVVKQVELVYGEQPAYADLVQTLGKHEYLHVNPADMNVILFAAVRQLSIEVETLKQLQHNTLLDQGLRINRLEKKLAKLLEEPVAETLPEVQVEPEPVPAAEPPPPLAPRPTPKTPAHVAPACVGRPVGPQNLKHPTSRPLSRPTLKRKI